MHDNAGQGFGSPDWHIPSGEAFRLPWKPIFLYPQEGRESASRRGRGIAAQRAQGCASCYWGWVHRPGGGSRRCRVCNLPDRIQRRHTGRMVRLQDRIAAGWVPRRRQRALDWLSSASPSKGGAW